MGNTIISAVYGTSTAGIDVTQTCQNIVNTDLNSGLPSK
jgi:hypothetical protein